MMSRTKRVELHTQKLQTLRLSPTLQTISIRLSTATTNVFRFLAEFAMIAAVVAMIVYLAYLIVAVLCSFGLLALTGSGISVHYCSHQRGADVVAYVSFCRASTCRFIGGALILV